MENFNLKKYLAESKLNEGKQTFPEDIWGEGKLPPLPDQKTWDEILAYMAMMLGESYGDKKSVIGTISGIALGTTKTGAYDGWKNSKK